MSAIQQKLLRTFEHLCAEDYDTALTLVCPLIDGAGKKIYGLKKTGERFRRVLKDNNAFLYWFITDGLVLMEGDLLFSRPGKKDITLGDTIYSIVRNSLLHEGELSAEVVFVDHCAVGPNDGKIVLPKTLVWALVFMVCCLPCYQQEKLTGFSLTYRGKAIPLHTVWGDFAKLRAHFSDHVFPIRA